MENFGTRWSLIVCMMLSLEISNVIVFRDSNNCIVIVVKQGQEPTSFKMIFDDWE